MRLLFVTHNYPRFVGDTAGNFVHRLALALREHGVHVDVLAPGAASLPQTDRVEGIAVHRVTYARPEHMTLAYGGTMAEAVRTSWDARFAFAGLVRAFRKDTIAHVARARREGKPYHAIHAHWWFPSGVSVWSARLFQALPSLVLTMHGSDVRLAYTKTVLHPLMRRVLRSASAVTAVSSWLAKTASSVVPDVNIEVAPMPVDTSRFVPLEDVPTSKSVLFVGRLNAQKGVADLLNAFARIPASDLHLDIVGDGPDADALRKQAASLSINERITWHGQRAPAEVAQLYRSAGVVAMPSRDEGLGLVAVEAQLCGTPVVGYDSGGLPDVIAPECGGALVPVGDIDQLSNALHTALQSDAARVAARTRGRQAMLERFAMPAVAQRYLELYNRNQQPS